MLVPVMRSLFEADATVMTVRSYNQEERLIGRLTSSYKRSQHDFCGEVEDEEQKFHVHTRMAGDQACPVIL